MDSSTLILLVIVGGVLFWWYGKTNKKNEERAVVANARLTRDKKLYDHIKSGMLEYEFRNRDDQFWKAKDRALLFETAQLSAFHVDHFAETRVGFYFKDLEEFGLYGFFVGNNPDTDVFHSYYRSDRTFEKEEMLLADDN